jgi:hypothetical protein
VALGADPATILAAVTPVPERWAKYQFAGLLRGARTELVKCLGSDLQVPASAEIVLEGRDSSGDTALEARSATTPLLQRAETFPVLTIERITLRRSPIYHSTYTGKPPDEPAILGVALNEVFVPMLAKQFPEITDFYLPPEGCSYRMAVVSMKKQYPGHAKRVMFGIWSYLRQFMYTKFIVVIDDDVERPRLEGSDLGDHHARRSGARHPDRREHADRLPGLRQPRVGSRLEDGHRRDQQMAGRDLAHLGPADRHGRGGEAKSGCALEGAGALAAVHPAQQLVHRRLREMRVGVVDHHHDDVTLALAVEHVAADCAHVAERAGLDVRRAGDLFALEALAHRPVDRNERHRCD